ncbi:MAG: 30S ribosome-binding factor RbfA [Thermodesulfobacteriota bacterium]
MTTHGYKRADRVGDSIMREIASMVVRGEIRDPRIGFITITHVKLSPDLKEAKVYFSRIGSSEEIANTTEGLESAVGYIRRNLGSRLKLRSVPTLRFYFDDTLEYAEHIDDLLKGINKEEGARDREGE